MPETGAGRTAPRAARSRRRCSDSCSAASASSRCSSFVAPTIGAVTPGLCSSQASATCAGGRRAPPRPRQRGRRPRSRPRACRAQSRERVGLRARRQPLAAARPVAGQQPARERAPRQHADALVDALRDHLPLLLAVDEVVVVLHRDEPRRRARAAPSRTATRTCCSRRCSAPCPPSRRRAAPPSSPRSASSGSQRWIWYRST